MVRVIPDPVGEAGFADNRSQTPGFAMAATKSAMVMCSPQWSCVFGRLIFWTATWTQTLARSA